ncbi:Bug family tripartite tricarboxylate transporter substrate binding protein [Nocardioides limicola]|uniref:Bug family tripartite tricarboxylate transporter substrate binding protein n=1 Tax=Nocardioides limicola TaxID=2803368 RepID=UPI00193BCA18|nr:tripartite tricarboxylate transporter substrate-binding protein [Nocardioides sp. DJM-14]
MRPPRWRLLATALLVASSLAGCAAQDREPLRIVVPNPPGGGYDVTARVVAAALIDDGTAARVTNLSGEEGLVAVTRIALEDGETNLLLQMGLGLVANAHTGGRSADLEALTPIALVLTEPNALMVARDSPFESVEQLLTVLRSDPEAVVLGGGSFPGGPDHQAALAVADGLGLPLGRLSYQPHDGGGEMLASLVAGRIDVAVAGTAQHLSQIQAGELRVLAVTGAARVPGVDAPTLLEAGVDVQFENWRGLLAPGGLSEEQRDRLVELLERARRTSTWQEAVARNGWSESWLTGDEFGEFLEQERIRVAALLEAVGPVD